MASEIRVNKINNRAGLGTITIADTGVVVNGIVTCTEVSGLNVLNIAGVSTFASTLDINGDIDVDGHTNLDNVSISGVSTFTDDVYFDGATAGRDIVFDRSENQLEFAPNAKAYFGGPYPLTIYNSTNSYISQNSNAALFIVSRDLQIYGSGGGYNSPIFVARNGIVELGYEPSGGSLSTQLKTSAKGITVGTGVTIETNGQATYTGIVTASAFSGSGASLTNLPAAQLSGTAAAINGSNITNLNASNIASGTVPTARLGSGTANSSTFLRGDSTFQTVNTDLVSDTSPQLGGDLDSNNFDIHVSDNKNLEFGDTTNPDLYIKHSVGHNANFIVSYNGDIEHHMTLSKKIIKGFQNSGTPYISLYHNNISMLQTESRGAFVTKGDGGDTTFTVGSTDASGVRICLDGDSNGDAYGNDYAFLQHTNGGNFVISADNPSGNAELIFCSGNSNQRAKFNSSGHFHPVTNDTYDLGTTGLRWANLYVNDLQLSNEAKKDQGGNDVDGTWGDWTLQEGENDIFMINKRNGKKFKINMTEVS